MTAIQFIASDMDHTLLTEKGELPPHLSDLISKLRHLGIEFAIASGRPLYTLHQIFQDTLDQMILIADNGGLISYHGRIVFKSLISFEVYQKIIQFIETQTDGVAILCGLDGAVISEKQAEHLDFLKTFYSQIKMVPNLSCLKIAADKLSIYFPNHNSKVLYTSVFNPKYGSSLSVTVGDSIWIDIMNQGVDKGSALRFLSNALDISADNMLAFGDTYNDIDMLKFVKFSYIVANAASDMSQYAKFTTQSNDDFGVTKIIEKVIQCAGCLDN